MKDLGVAKHYPGMDIDYRREEGIVMLSQVHAAVKIFETFSIQDCKPTTTPMEAKLILLPHVKGDTDVTNSSYRQLIGYVL